MAAVKQLPLTDAQGSVDSKFWGFCRMAREHSSGRLAQRRVRFPGPSPGGGTRADGCVRTVTIV
jgi:hypothetical protein